MGGAGEGTRVTADDPDQEAPDTAVTSEPDRLQVLRDALEKSPEVPADESVALRTSVIGPTLQNRMLGSRLASNNLLRLRNTLAASPAFQVGEQVQRAISGSVVSTMPFRNLVDDNVSRTMAAALGRQAAGLGFGVTTPTFKSLIDDSVATTAAAISRQAYAGIGFGVTAPTFKDLLEIDRPVTRGFGLTAAIPPMNNLFGGYGRSIADAVGAQLFRSPGIGIQAAYQRAFGDIPVLDSIRDVAARLIRHVPGLANRAVIGARWARAAILRGDPDFEEIVDDFIRYWLEIRRITQAVREGAVEALLGPWDQIAPGQLLKFLRDKTLQLAKLQRPIFESRHQHQRQRFYIGSLDVPTLESDTTEGMRLASLNPTPEELLVGTQLVDPRLQTLFSDLDPVEQNVAIRHSEGWTWAEAAALNGQPPAYGESVRRKIKRRIGCTPAIYGARP